MYNVKCRTIEQTISGQAYVCFVWNGVRPFEVPTSPDTIN